MAGAEAGKAAKDSGALSESGLKTKKGELRGKDLNPNVQFMNQNIPPQSGPLSESALARRGYLSQLLLLALLLILLIERFLKPPRDCLLFFSSPKASV